MKGSVCRLKRVVIKEELVELTGNFISALILNQFLYWTERTQDIDSWIDEENVRRDSKDIEETPEEELPKTYGWTYKTAEDLNGELMLGMSAPTIRKYLKQLIDKGFITERRNPKYKWDKTLQYRINIIEISDALEQLGYHLEGYRFSDAIEPSKEDTTPKQNDLASEQERLAALSEITSEIPQENKTMLLEPSIEVSKSSPSEFLAFKDLSLADKKERLKNDFSKLKQSEIVGLLGDVLIQDKDNAAEFLAAASGMKKVYPELGRMVMTFPLDFLTDFLGGKIPFKEGADWKKYIWGSCHHQYPIWCGDREVAKHEARKRAYNPQGFWREMIAKEGGER